MFITPLHRTSAKPQHCLYIDPYTDVEDIAFACDVMFPDDTALVVECSTVADDEAEIVTAAFREVLLDFALH